jgi:hypothetical protein
MDPDDYCRIRDGREWPFCITTNNISDPRNTVLIVGWQKNTWDENQKNESGPHLASFRFEIRVVVIGI